MIKNIFYKIFKTLFIIYNEILPLKRKFETLENLDFRKVDFTNYKKIKILIFKNEFIKNNKEPSVYNYDFLNYAVKIGGKKGIDIGKENHN